MHIQRSIYCYKLPIETVEVETTNGNNRQLYFHVMLIISRIISIRGPQNIKYRKPVIIRENPHSQRGMRTLTESNRCFH